MSIGGGVCTSGEGVEALRCAARLLAEAGRLQVTLQEQVASFVPHLRKRGYTAESEIRARLTKITPEGCQVLFPDYQLLANVKLRDDSILMNA
jgi:Rad3-related DNA helicase